MIRDAWKSRLLHLVVFSLLLVVAAPRVLAQAGATGAISGTVLDSSGALIPGAEVRIVDNRTAQPLRTLTTDSSGKFVAALLPPSTYSVVVNAKGFGEQVTSGIEVRVTETTRISVSLRPSQRTEKIEVAAQVAEVDTEDATTGQTITTETVRTLPLATQNFQQLLALSTGASDTLNNATQLGRGNVNISVNGQRTDNNNYQIEGISATDYNVASLANTPLPNPDVLEEFKVQTSMYDASNGRNGGGNVNAVLKSGTKDFHFDAYEFFRNGALDANGYFFNNQGVARPVLSQNIFGVSAGGPVGTEKLGYFFANYQGTRQRSGDDNGTFISTEIPVFPSVRNQQTLSQAFFGNTTTQIDPVVLALLNVKSNQFGGAGGGYLIPSISGTVGSFAPFVYSSPGTFNDDQFTTTWDKSFHHDVDRLAVRFFFSNSQAVRPFGAGGSEAEFGLSINPTDLNFPLAVPINTRFLNAGETHTFSPSVVNVFHFGYTRINNSSINTPIVTASDLGINRPTNSLTPDIYKFTFGSSGFQIGPTPGANQYQTQDNYSFTDTLSWIHGKHQMSFGGDATHVGLSKFFPGAFNGQLIFASGGPGQPSDIQNFLMGSPQFSFGGSGNPTHEYRINNFSVFAQDNYKVTSDVTLNLGLRVDINGAFHDDACHIGNVDPTRVAANENPFIYPKCVNQFDVPGFQGTTSSTTLRNNYSTGLAPRFGLAYDLFGHHTTTIRVGYGIYYVREDVGAVDQLSFLTPLQPVAFGGGPPGCLGTFFSSAPASGCPNPNPNALPPVGVISPAYVPVLSQLTGFVNNQTGLPTSDTSQTPVYNNNTIDFFALQVPQHFVVPSVQQWNLTVQRTLGSKWVLEVGYVGTHAIHLRETRDSQQASIATAANPLTVMGTGGQSFLITTTTISNGAARSKTQGLNGYSAFELFSNDAYSHYNSLQSTLSRRWGGGYFQAAYTFSRSTDTTSTGNTAVNTAFNDQTSLADSRGLSDFDRPQRLAVSYVYDFPLFKDATGPKAVALKDWGISGATVFQSGTPFSIFDSAAGTAYDAQTTISATASLAPGATLSDGLTKGSIQSRLNGYVNVNAFVHAPIIGDDGLASGFGNLGRNIYRGPFEQNWDLSLIKHFRITEHQDLRFTADFFNIWNHPVFSNPAFTDVENPASFGHIVGTENNPRIIQFSLRYSF